MAILFFAFVFLTVYAFIVYPAMLFLVASIVRRPWSKEEITPPVTIIISAYNEEAVIEQKVLNSLALDYPPEALQVLVVSDGSTDGTEAIVSSIADDRVKLVSFRRSGKTACLNRVVPIVSGEIVVFTDANSLFPPGAIRRLVSNFADEKVGAVTGWTEYVDPENGKVATGIYSRFEKKLKSWESIVCSCVGADGAIFAIRKNLFRRLRDDDINDLVIPLDVIKAGRRVIMGRDVFCHEQPAPGVFGEYRRQARITTRSLRALGRNMQCMNPFRFGLFSFFLLSHKGLKMAFPFFMLGAAATSVLLYASSDFFKLVVWLEVLIAGLAVYGMTANRRNRLIEVITTFMVTAVAHMVGWLRIARGISDVVWTPRG